MKCKNCGAILGAEDKFCSICGLSTQEPEKNVKCASCGADLADKDRFCPACGKPVSDDIQQNNLELMRNASSTRLFIRKRRRSFNVKMLLLLLLLLLTAAGFLLGTILEWWKL